MVVIVRCLGKKSWLPYQKKEYHRNSGPKIGKSVILKQCAYEGGLKAESKKLSDMQIAERMITGHY